MKVVVLQGSTKSVPKRSVTKAYIDFIKQNFKEHSFEVFPIGYDIAKIEGNDEFFDSILEHIAASDLILWAVPVYSGLVPSSVKRFIELVVERKREDAFKGVYVGALVATASIFDDLAISYLRAVSEDLGCFYVDSFSATIYPLINEQYKAGLRFFFENLLSCSKEKRPVVKEFIKVERKTAIYRPEDILPVEKSSERKVVIIADYSNRESNLAKMIDNFRALSPFDVEIINLRELGYAQCVDCLKCASAFVCALEDGFQDMYKQKVLTADAVIFAGEIKDRFLSSLIKLFLDREFCYNHSLIHQGRLFGALVSGPLAENYIIRKVLSSIVELRGGVMIDFISDEPDDSKHLTTLIGSFAERIGQAIKNRVTKPLSFSGVGAQKIMRDMAYLSRFPFKGDYEHFKNNLFKHYPQRKKKLIFKATMLNVLAKFKGEDATLEMYKEARNAGFRGLLLSEEQSDK